MPSTYTPLRYPGGKSKLRPFVKSIIQENGFTKCQYIEPYAGGSGLALGLLINEIVWSITINDLNPFIYAFWKSVMDSPEDLCRLVYDTPVTVDEWHRQKKIIKSNKKNLSPLEMAFAALYLNRTNRSGILDGGVIGGLEQEGNYKIDARYNRKTLSTKIKRIASYQGRIIVRNLDAVELLEKLPSDNQLFVNLDPPYIAQGKNLYLNHYDENDHKKVRDTLRNAQYKWMLTYDNHELAKKLYKSFRWYNYSLKYTAQNRYSATEVMVFSDSLKVDTERSPIALIKGV